MNESWIFTLMSGATEAVRSISCTRKTVVGKTDPQGADERVSSCSMLADGRYRWVREPDIVVFDGDSCWMSNATDGGQGAKALPKPLPNPLYGLIAPDWLRPELGFTELGVVEVDGRRCHAVAVYEHAGDGPARGALLYTLAVDAEFGIIMRLVNEREDYETELADVQINTPLDEDLFRLDRDQVQEVKIKPPGPFALPRALLKYAFRKDGR